MKKLLGMLLCLAVSTAHSASISLSPANQAVNLGDQVSIDLLMDFSGDPTLGGGLDVFYDGTRLDFLSFIFDATFLTLTDPLLTCPGAAGCTPALDQPGVVTNIAFGDFGALGGPHLVGTLLFDTLATGNVTLTTAETTGSAGPFVSDATLVAQLVNYGTADVTINAAVVPLPAGIWLMLSGLIGFMPVLRSRSKN